MKESELSRILITGAGGMIGRAVPFGIKLTRKQLDVKDAAATDKIFQEINPLAVLHLASLDIRTCESNPREALEVNVLATRRLALMCREARIPLVFLSSGAVFNGRKGQVFLESDEPDPINLYAQTKYLGERLISELLPNQALIIRAGWVFGGHGAHHKKFVDVARDQAINGETIQASDDQTGSPLYVMDLIDKLRLLILAEERGIVHLANTGVATAKQIADEIVRLLGSRSLVKAASSHEILDTIRRSHTEALASAKHGLRPWKQSLAAYLKS
jgi:dTDP-4-dehydrorhamnose reductase